MKSFWITKKMWKKAKTSLLAKLLLAGLLGLFPLLSNGLVALAASSPITVVSNYVLTSDITFDTTGFIIAADNIVLDLNGHTIMGTPGSLNSYGVQISNHNGVTIKNGTIRVFDYGVFLDNSDGNSLIGNTIVGGTDGKNYGIFLGNGSDSNILTNNSIQNGPFVATPNLPAGIWLKSSLNNTVQYNSITGGTTGIVLETSSNSLILGNSVANVVAGGLSIREVSNGNTLRNNTVSNCGRGFTFVGTASSGNTLYNNNFIGNTNAFLFNPASPANLFNLGLPAGGNYWSNWNSPDNNHDGFVDSPFIFTSGNTTFGQDNLPWAMPNGWHTLGLLPSSDANALGTQHTVTAAYKLDGIPQQGVQINFRITFGPNAGENGSGTTDINGQAKFTYTGDGGVGLDTIQATAIDQAGTLLVSEQATKNWTHPLVPSASFWGNIALVALLGSALIWIVRKNPVSSETN